MQIRISKNRILIGLLLCSLLLTGYISVFNTAGVIPSEMNVFARSSMSGGSQSSMKVAVNTWPLDYLTADTAIDFSNLSIKQSRWLFAKTNSDTLTAATAALMICFIYSSRLSDQICSQFNSIQITFFLHKKDGMK